MIVLKKDGHTTAPLSSVEDAKKMVSEGWKVWINKTGVKLDAKSEPKPKAKPKKSKKKSEDK